VTILLFVALLVPAPLIMFNRWLNGDGDFGWIWAMAFYIVLVCVAVPKVLP
jgi:hypothetical protein